MKTAVFFALALAITPLSALADEGSEEAAQSITLTDAEGALTLSSKGNMGSEVRLNYQHYGSAYFDSEDHRTTLKSYNLKGAVGHSGGKLTGAFDFGYGHDFAQFNGISGTLTPEVFRVRMLGGNLYAFAPDGRLSLGGSLYGFTGRRENSDDFLMSILPLNASLEAMLGKNTRVILDLDGALLADPNCLFGEQAAPGEPKRACGGGYEGRARLELQRKFVNDLYVSAAVSADSTRMKVVDPVTETSRSNRDSTILFSVGIGQLKTAKKAAD